MPQNSFYLPVKATVDFSHGLPKQPIKGQWGVRRVLETWIKHFFFSFCFIFESIDPIENGVLGIILISHIDFRVLGSTSTTRKPSNYRVVEVAKPIEELFPMVRYEADLSDTIELPSGRSGKVYRITLTDGSIWSRPLGNYRITEWSKWQNLSESTSRWFNTASQR